MTDKAHDNVFQAEDRLRGLKEETIDGELCVRVPLSNYHTPALLLKEDWTKYREAGYSPNLRFNGKTRNTGAVVVANNRVDVPVARILLYLRTGTDPKAKGIRIKYLSDDRLDLRPSNLTTEKGGRGKKVGPASSSKRRKQRKDKKPSTLDPDLIPDELLVGGKKPTGIGDPKKDRRDRSRLLKHEEFRDGFIIDSTSTVMVEGPRFSRGASERSEYRKENEYLEKNGLPPLPKRAAPTKLAGFLALKGEESRSCILTIELQESVRFSLIRSGVSPIDASPEPLKVLARNTPNGTTVRKYFKDTIDGIADELGLPDHKPRGDDLNLLLELYGLLTVLNEQWYADANQGVRQKNRQREINECEETRKRAEAAIEIKRRFEAECAGRREANFKKLREAMAEERRKNPNLTQEDLKSIWYRVLKEFVASNSEGAGSDSY